jgi:hypothetical protein
MTLALAVPARNTRCAAVETYKESKACLACINSIHLAINSNKGGENSA